TLFAVFHRRRQFISMATYAGLFWMITGIACACPQVLTNPERSTIALAPMLFVQALYFLHRYALQPRFEWAGELLTKPTLQTLRFCSLLLSVACVIGPLGGADPRGAFGALSGFVALQLAWHGLQSRRLIFGFALFAVDLMTLLAWTYRAGRGDHALLA